ncbi:MAG: GIY-YIG nuclease family protein [Planctomycetota bacterium]|jgi:hypothetical protein
MSYQELLDNLQTAEEALKEFDSKYPNINIELVFPREISLGVAARVFRAYQEHLNDAIAYLDDDERDDGIQVGNYSLYENRRRLKRIDKQIERAKNKFTAELEQCIDLHTTLLVSMYLEKSQISAKKTAQLSDNRYTLQREIYDAGRAIADYNIAECTKFSVMEDVPVQYCSNTKFAPSLPGVYFLLQQGEIIYIGHSRNMQERLNNNDIVREYYRHSDKGGYNVDCVVCPCPFKKAKELERALISLAKPEYNIQGAE